MRNEGNLPVTNGILLYPLFFVAIMWVVFWVETRFNINFNYLGILPRDIVGLRGILFGPFIHGSLQHIFNNSVPLFVLSVALFYFYSNVKWRILFIGTIITGLITWSIGRHSLHIGASGVVYMLASFLFFKGIFSKQYQLTALSLAVVFIYGSLLWYVFPIDDKISWEGHLSGFLVGFVFSFLFKEIPLKSKKYSWQLPGYSEEDDPFLKQFDEQGNFIEKLPEMETEIAPETASKDITTEIKVVYTITKQRKADEDSL